MVFTNLSWWSGVWVAKSNNADIGHWTQLCYCVRYCTSMHGMIATT